MSRPIVKARIAELVKEIESLAGDLEADVALLKKTIAYNREDVHGVIMRIHCARENYDRLDRLGAKLKEVQDLWYKLPSKPSDPTS